MYIKIKTYLWKVNKEKKMGINDNILIFFMYKNITVSKSLFQMLWENMYK